MDIYNEINSETFKMEVVDDLNDSVIMEKNETKAVVDKIHKCKHCEKTFTEDRNMKRHIQTVHEGRKDYQCPHCDQYFGLKQVLERHIVNVHNSQKDYKIDPKIEIETTRVVWDVESLYDYQYFNCPSCSFKSDHKQNFVDHTFHTHPESMDYFRNISDGSLSDIIIPWNNDKISPTYGDLFFGLKEQR